MPWFWTSDIFWPLTGLRHFSIAMIAAKMHTIHVIAVAQCFALILLSITQLLPRPQTRMQFDRCSFKDTACLKHAWNESDVRLCRTLFFVDFLEGQGNLLLGSSREDSVSFSRSTFFWRCISCIFFVVAFGRFEKKNSLLGNKLEVAAIGKQT